MFVIIAMCVYERQEDFVGGLPPFMVVRLKIKLYLKENLHFIVLKQYNISKLVYLVSNTFRLLYQILIRIMIFKLIVSKKL